MLFLARPPGRVEPFDVLLFVRDLDDRPDRKRGFHQAREAVLADSGVAVVAGWPNQAMEAWVLCAWNPGPDGRAVHRTIRQELGFDPCTHPERLPHGPKAKSVVARLLAASGDTADDLLEAADLATLLDRGGGCGLAPFLRDLERVGAAARPPRSDGPAG